MSKTKAESDRDLKKVTFQEIRDRFLEMIHLLAAGQKPDRSMTEKKLMYPVGKAAQKAGVSRQSLQYYLMVGLLEPTQIPLREGGYLMQTQSIRSD